jgi:Cu(I)/Ag(I) efflux system membrane fusion protein
MRRRATALLAAVLLLAAGIVIGRGCGPRPSTAPSESPGAMPAQPAAEPVEVERWSCPMHPQIEAHEPGACPICGMDLVPIESPVEAPHEMPMDLDGAPSRRLELSPEAARLAEIRTAAVERRRVDVELSLLGTVEYDETRVREITAWIPGRLTRLYVDFTGVAVRRGAPLVRIYSPELIAAQEEFLQALRARDELLQSGVRSLRDTAQATVDAARDKLRLLGLSRSQIARLEQREAPEEETAIPAPIDGVVVAKHAREGMYVETGTPLYTLVDLSRVWVQLDAYESDLVWLGVGQTVSFSAEGLPGRSFEGRIVFVDPVLSASTRTARVRLEAENPDGLLRPEMFVRATVHPRARRAGEAAPLVIPASAPLLTGRRAVVYVAVPDAAVPTFEGREIELGARAGEWYVVESGLAEGERVVTRGAFKIDSALQIRAQPSMMLPQGGMRGGTAPHDGHAGHAP